MKMQFSKKEKKEIENFFKEVKKYNKEKTALMKKHKLEEMLVITYPNLKKIPRICKISMWIINAFGGEVNIQFKIKK